MTLRSDKRETRVRFEITSMISDRNHNEKKILKSDWLSTALISSQVGQFNRTVLVTYASVIGQNVPSRALKWLFFTAGKKKVLEFLVF